LNINEIHSFINFIADKEMQGYFPSARIDDCLELAQMDEFNKYIPEKYSPWQEPHMALSPFKRSFDFITSSDGTFDVSMASGYNSNEPFIYLTMVDVAVADNSLSSASPVPRHTVDFINEGELTDRRNSQLIPMSSTSPVMIQTGASEFQLFPNQEHAGTCRYIKKPPKPVFAYTQVGRVVTYDAANSTQLLWSWQYQKKIIFGAMTYLGINLNEDALIKYSAQLANG
jgi:hypothetical protein